MPVEAGGPAASPLAEEAGGASAPAKESAAVPPPGAPLAQGQYPAGAHTQWGSDSNNFLLMTSWHCTFVWCEEKVWNSFFLCLCLCLLTGTL